MCWGADVTLKSLYGTSRGTDPFVYTAVQDRPANERFCLGEAQILTQTQSAAVLTPPFRIKLLKRASSRGIFLFLSFFVGSGPVDVRY